MYLLRYFIPGKTSPVTFALLTYLVGAKLHDGVSPSLFHPWEEESSVTFALLTYLVGAKLHDNVSPPLFHPWEEESSVNCWIHLLMYLAHL